MRDRAKKSSPNAPSLLHEIEKSNQRIKLATVSKFKLTLPRSSSFTKTNSPILFKHYFCNPTPILKPSLPSPSLTTEPPTVPLSPLLPPNNAARVLYTLNAEQIASLDSSKYSSLSLPSIRPSYYPPLQRRRLRARKELQFNAERLLADLKHEKSLMLPFNDSLEENQCNYPSLAHKTKAKKIVRAISQSHIPARRKVNKRLIEKSLQALSLLAPEMNRLPIPPSASKDTILYDKNEKEIATNEERHSSDSVALKNFSNTNSFQKAKQSPRNVRLIRKENTEEPKKNIIWQYSMEIVEEEKKLLSNDLIILEKKVSEDIDSFNQQLLSAEEDEFPHERLYTLYHHLSSSLSTVVKLSDDIYTPSIPSIDYFLSIRLLDWYIIQKRVYTEALNTKIEHILSMDIDPFSTSSINEVPIGNVSSNAPIVPKGVKKMLYDLLPQVMCAIHPSFPSSSVHSPPQAVHIIQQILLQLLFLDSAVKEGILKKNRIRWNQEEQTGMALYDAVEHSNKKNVNGIYPTCSGDNDCSLQDLSFSSLYNPSASKHRLIAVDESSACPDIDHLASQWSPVKKEPAPKKKLVPFENGWKGKDRSSEEQVVSIDNLPSLLCRMPSMSLDVLSVHIKDHLAKIWQGFYRVAVETMEKKRLTALPKVVMWRVLMEIVFFFTDQGRKEGWGDDVGSLGVRGLLGEVVEDLLLLEQQLICCVKTLLLVDSFDGVKKLGGMEEERTREVLEERVGEREKVREVMKERLESKKFTFSAYAMFIRQVRMEPQRVFRRKKVEEGVRWKMYFLLQFLWVKETASLSSAGMILFGALRNVMIEKRRDWDASGVMEYLKKKVGGGMYSAEVLKALILMDIFVLRSNGLDYLSNELEIEWKKNIHKDMKREVILEEMKKIFSSLKQEEDYLYKDDDGMSYMDMYVQYYDSSVSRSRKITSTNLTMMDTYILQQLGKRVTFLFSQFHAFLYKFV